MRKKDAVTEKWGGAAASPRAKIDLRVRRRQKHRSAANLRFDVRLQLQFLFRFSTVNSQHSTASRPCHAMPCQLPVALAIANAGRRHGASVTHAAAVPDRMRRVASAYKLCAFLEPQKKRPRQNERIQTSRPPHTGTPSPLKLSKVERP